MYFGICQRIHTFIDTFGCSFFSKGFNNVDLQRRKGYGDLYKERRYKYKKRPLFQ